MIAAVLMIIVGLFLTDFGADSGSGPWLVVLGGLSLIALALVGKRALDGRWPN